MFEEDYERCFICQAPCKGLYCSSMCRVQDKGTPSPAVKPATSTVKLTSQLPASLSPMLRPAHYQIATSPRLPPSHGDSSSSSSITSSPIQSPRTNPSATDSPRKESFHLPPLAYPKDTTMPSSFAFAGSMPVKIPNLAPRAEKHTPTTHTPVSNGSVYPFGTSIDTLRFGRKPGSTNSVVSPNALGPSCHCGQSYGHKHRATSKDRGLEAGLTHLTLGPSVVSHELYRPSHRIVSETSASPGKPLLLNNLTQAATGYNTPAELDPRGASYLSRSRSDPIPSPEAMRRAHAAGPLPNRGPASRRASNLGGERHALFSPTMKPVVDLSGTVAPSLAQSPRRGRSRERQHYPVDREISAGGFNLPPDREHPPSRSRHRREERRRSPESRERQRTPASVFAPLPEILPETSPENRIVPSWLRRASPELGPGEGIAPVRRNVSGTPRSPIVRPDVRQEELRRADEQLSQVFGVAAG
ncbi:hypothetical protein DB88DRAFT_36090 [Papiliotrema laurentii]|uniref:Uncharacterized protein n=1 Tax=Papiliotrema laurentii TaxID=5418 RepID=A0AAD9L909_PAPLA|nr:hypothetical protein DB88DRAFT_36090 [Papiliotrema laurentii]